MAAARSLNIQQATASLPVSATGGYDVLHYDLDLRYATTAPSQSIVGSVSVDGRSAAFRREGEELVITPRRPLDRHEKFIVRVSHFVATPTEAGEAPESTAFFVNVDGSATAPQPYIAHLIYPSNDHPRDKARFTFRLDVPAGTVAVANGLPLGHWTSRGRTVWAYVERDPMATELTQLAVGDYAAPTSSRSPRRSRTATCRGS